MKQNKDETAIDFLRRVVGWLEHENESILQDLPSTQAILEYAALWSVYDTDLMSGIVECIEEGNDPKPLADFIAKYNLSWTVPEPVTDEA